MNFLIYNNKRLKHPVRFGLLLIFIIICIFSLLSVYEKQQQFSTQEENLKTLQEQLNKINKQNPEASKNLVTHDQQKIMQFVNTLNTYPKATILLKKIEFKSISNQFEVSGEATTIEALSIFKDVLSKSPPIKSIDVFSTSSLTENKVYKIEFLFKGAL